MMKRFGAILLAMCVVMQSVTPVFAEELMADVVTEVVTDEQEAAVDSDVAGVDADDEEDAFLEDSNLLINDDAADHADTEDALTETATEAEDPFVGLIEDEGESEKESEENMMTGIELGEFGDAGDPFYTVQTAGDTIGKARFASSVNAKEYYGSKLQGNAKTYYSQLKVISWSNKGNVINSYGYEVGSYVAEQSNGIRYTYTPTAGYAVENDPRFISTFEKFKIEVFAAVNAYIYDYPEAAFWMDATGFVYSYGSGYITMGGFTTEERWLGAKNEASDFKNQLASAEAQLRGSMSSSTTIGEKLKLVHDYICNNTSYGDGVNVVAREHSPYGVYSGTHKVVCEGYAKLFKVLVDRLNIAPVVIVTGDGVTSTGAGAHMWNKVQINGLWYNVDATWDDQSVIYYKYFLAGNNSEGFDKRTFAQSHINIEQSNTPSAQATMYHERQDVHDNFTSCDVESVKTSVCKLHPIPKTYDSYETETLSEVRSATNHTWDNGVRQQDGSYLYTCTICDETKVVKANWDGGTVTQAATCKSTGVRTYHCTDAGFEDIYRIETIPVNPNNHAHVVNDPAVAATCTSTGLTAGSHCSDCGKVIKARTTTAALGHSYGPWRTTKAATYFATGLETRSCTRCGDTQSRVLAQIPNPMSVRVNKTSFTWTGKAQKPKVKAVTVNGKKLKSKEYKVTYSNNKNVGTGTVTVTGKKQYSSYKAMVTFKINLPKAKISSAKSKKAGTVVLSWKKIGGVAGYEIQYPGGTIRVSGTKYTFAGLTSKKKASFKVRAYAYVDGVMQYGAWSSAKSCKVK